MLAAAGGLARAPAGRVTGGCPMKSSARSASDKHGLVDLPQLDSHELLRAMQAVQEGNFSVRLPRHWTGLSGKIADTFNTIVASNERMAAELQRVGHVVGKQ